MAGSRVGLVYLGVFLTAVATLTFEVLLTRIISVITWYHFAFFVISLAMLGLTAGAVFVFVRPGWFEADAIPVRLAQSALAFAVALPISAAVTLTLPLVPVGDFMSFVALVTTGFVLALPFFASGVVLTLAITRAGLPANLVYGVDLVGAAAGCGLAIPLLATLDAPSAALIAGALAAFAAASFGAAAGSSRLPALTVAIALVGLAVANASSAPPPLRPAWRKGAYEDPATYMYTGWNSYSRVTVESMHGPPALWALGARAPLDVLKPLEQRVIKIDGAAATVMAPLGDSPAAHRYLDWELPALVHEFRPGGAAAVIGVGGGRDVLAAARVGRPSIVGIELNALIVELHRGEMAEFSGITQLPGVTLVTDEARSFLTRDPRQYGVITMSLIDTWAALGSGAYSLSENGLYTVEAWQMLIRKLAPDGVLAVSRWYFQPNPGEVARMLVVAFDALWGSGVSEPRQHLALLQREQVATLFLSRQPLSAADRQRLEQLAAERGFQLLLAPNRLPETALLREAASQPSREALAAWGADQVLDMSAPSDDRPFFFNMLRPRDWLTDPRAIDQLDMPFVGNLAATQTLLYAVLASLLLTAAAVVWPLRARLRDLTGIPRSDLAAAFAYFALIGLGFMFVEVGMLSRLNAFLGHPTLALAVLLGGVIFFTGIGSMFSQRIDVSRRGWVLAYPLLPAACVLVVSLILPELLERAAGASSVVRSLVSLAVLCPIALGMGLCFPLGLRLCEAMERARGGELRLGPWLWSINGAFGVCASGLALLSAMTMGITATLWLGTLCYAALPVAALRLHRQPAA